MTVGPIRLRRYPSLRQMQKSATVPPNARIFPISHQHMGRFAERDCRAYWGGGNYYVAQMAYAAAVKRWPAAAGRACGEGHLATAITKPRTQLLVGFRRSIAFVCSPGPGSAPALMALPCSKRSQAVAAIVIRKAARAIVAITILICARCDGGLDWLGMTVSNSEMQNAAKRPQRVSAASETSLEESLRKLPVNYCNKPMLRATSVT